MKTKVLMSIGGVLLSFAALYAAYVFATHFWYKEPRYTIGVENATSVTIDNVLLILKPEGEFSCGILSSNNFKRHMDPRWPIPEEVILRFTNETETKRYELRKKVSIPKDFKGDLTVEVSKGANDFIIELKQEPRTK